MPLQPGSVVGNYRVLGTLGVGGMGYVYKVQNLLSNRTEAMKVLRSELTERPELAERFLREIQVQASLVHPHITSLHTALQIDGQLLMLMEFVEGETLEARLTRGALGLEEGLAYAAQILDALAYAHRLGVIHRDLKPGNIMLSTGGQAKLMDFGLAAGEFDKRLTRTGTVMGSLPYMSPEQVRGQPPTTQSDVYSFGLTLYEMLTGVRGIRGESDYEVMTAHLQQTPDPPAYWNPSIPAAVSDIVSRSIAKDPATRFHSAEEMKLALANYQNPAPTAPRPFPAAQHPTPAQAPVQSQPASNRWPWVAALGGILVLAMAGAGAYAVFRPRTAPPPSVVIEAPPVAESAPPQVAPPAKQTPAPPAPTPETKASIPPPSAQPTAAPPSAGPVGTVAAPSQAPPVATPAVASNLTPLTAPKVVPAPGAPPPAKPTAPVATPNPAIVQQAAARQIILDVARRLEAAYASRDMDQVLAVFPAMPPDRVTRLRQLFKDTRTVMLEVQPAGEPRIGTSRLQILCRYTMAAKFRDGREQKPTPNRARVELGRRGANWVVESVEFVERGKSLYQPL